MPVGWLNPGAPDAGGLNALPGCAYKWKVGLLVS